MNLIVDVPVVVRLAVAFCLGAMAGALVNLGVYRLAWRPRAISPWSAPPKDAPPRRWSDRVPILGWLGLRRESGLHGRAFWVRPLLVELFAGAAAAWLYWWEVDREALLPANLARPLTPALLANLHAQYACHGVLILLMAVASLIDLDEKTIPDAVTVSGTLFGLAAAAWYPWCLLPVVQQLPNGQEARGFLHLASPHDWPAWLAGFPQAWSLVVGLGCWWLWCVALLPRHWRFGLGWRRAAMLFWVGLVREPITWRILGMGVAGSAAVAVVWLFGGVHWIGLLSALVGMAASGGLVWAVRIIGAAVLRREAMGFGDVTLMAMMGTLVGWQTSLLVFFLAPLLAIANGLLALILRREREIPYGPFLCMAGVLAIVGWDAIWSWAEGQVFVLGLWVPAILVFCLGAMAILLALIDRIRQALFPSPEDQGR